MPPEPSYLVVDIETVIDPALPRAEQEEGSLPPPPFHQIVVLGVAWLDAAGHVRRFGILGEGKSEPEMLRDFTRFVGERKPDLVTYNGRGFDLPVIVARCLHHGVAFRHYYAERELRYRFSPQGHLDLMDFLSDFGASRASKLDVVARSIGMPGKVGVAGKDVGPLVHAGRLADVQAYCLCDVVQTAALFLRVQLLRGALAEPAYLDAMRALITVIEGDGRLAHLGGAMDRARLLLETG
jgi:predicted PolB exonuclease-like 3'-5' exonuclease